MPQREVCPKGYSKVPQTTDQEASVHLRSSTKSKSAFDFTFEAIRPNLFRATFSSAEHPIPPYPSVTKPEINLEGVNVFAKEGASSKTLDVAGVTASIDWEYTPVVKLSWTGSEKPLHKDLPLRSYVVDGEGVANYSVHNRECLHVGLGEKAAPMDLTGRQFQLSATDSFG